MGFKSSGLLGIRLLGFRSSRFRDLPSRVLIWRSGVPLSTAGWDTLPIEATSSCRFRVSSDGTLGEFLRDCWVDKGVGFWASGRSCERKTIKY